MALHPEGNCRVEGKRTTMAVIVNMPSTGKPVPIRLCPGCLKTALAVLDALGVGYRLIQTNARGEPRIIRSSRTVPV